MMEDAVVLMGADVLPIVQCAGARYTMDTAKEQFRLVEKPWVVMSFDSCGGRLVLHPPDGIRYRSATTPIIGNTCLYGATGGELFAAGTAGERFAVRNSGAIAVIEGTGDHCCEYMTGGVVVVLGPTGINFGAGMTGGFAYVLDLDRGFVDRYNHQLIDIIHIAPDSMENHVHHLRALVQRHRELTGSKHAECVLDDFRRMLPKFWLVKPKAAELEGLIAALRNAA